MSYDWTQHLAQSSTIDSGGRVGSSAGGRLYIGVSVSELRTDFDFWVSYVSTIVERYLLPARDDVDVRAAFCNVLLDLLDDYEREAEVRAGARKDLGAVNPAPLAFDWSGE